MSPERSVRDVFGPYNLIYGGEGGIRTHGTVSRTLAFEASTFNHSVTSPHWFGVLSLAKLRETGYRQGDRVSPSESGGDERVMQELAIVSPASGKKRLELRSRILREEAW